MTIDPSIIGGLKQPQIESPVNALAQMLQVQGVQQQNKLGQAKLDEYSRGVERSNKLRDLVAGLGGSATDDQRINAMKTGGYFDEADKLQTGMLARQKTGAEVAKDTATAAKTNQDVLTAKLQHHKDALGPVGDPQSAALWVAQMYADPDMAPIVKMSGKTLDQVVATIPQDPAGFAKWKLQSSLGADKLVEYTTANANTVANNNTSIATNAATNARVAAEGKANRGQADEHFKATQEAGKSQIVQSDDGPILVNTKTGTGKSVLGPDGKQLAGVTKPLNDSQSKALLFGTRMQEAHKVLGTLAGEGTTISVPGSRMPGIGSVINALSPEKQQMLDQAKRDFMTAVLRRESGASISPGEFDTADKQYFPQPGEGAKQIAQKARNRELAINGVLVEVPEKHRGAITPKAAPAAPSPAAAAGPAPQVNAQGWALHTDASGNRAYVSPDGKQFKEVH